jgi:hypothetical protein
MRFQTSRLTIVSAMLACVIVGAGAANTSGQGPVSEGIALVAQITGIASSINSLLNPGGDPAANARDLAQIKAKLDEMDQKLDNIAKSINALPGFITEQFSEESERTLATEIRTISTQFDEWAADPQTNRHEIIDAMLRLHQASDNVIYRTDRTPNLIYSTYNIVALAMAMATEYNLISLTQRKTAIAPSFEIYANFFRDATSGTVTGSLANYKAKLDSEIASTEKGHAALTKNIICVIHYNWRQDGNNCGYDYGNLVQGDLKSGYHETGAQIFTLSESQPATCPVSKRPSSDSRIEYTSFVPKASIGCSKTSAGRSGPDLNRERDVYDADKEAEVIATAALNAAIKFRRTAFQLAHRLK